VTKVNKLTLAVILAGTLTAGCGSTPPPDPCQINPTKTNEAGVWVEGDDEPMDSDPCDSDDLTEDGHFKPGVRKPTKPVVQKPAVQKPAGGSGGTSGNKPRK